MFLTLIRKYIFIFARLVKLAEVKFNDIEKLFIYKNTINITL